MSRDASLLRYYMGFRVIGWIWIIAVLVFAIYRFFVSPTIFTVLYELFTGSGTMIDMAIVGLLAIGIIIEWYGSFKLFTLRRRIRPRAEAEEIQSR